MNIEGTVLVPEDIGYLIETEITIELYIADINKQDEPLVCIQKFLHVIKTGFSYERSDQ